MTRPDAAAIKEVSQVDFAARGYEDDELELVVAMACAYIEQVTGRPLDATMPPSLEPIALQAVRMRTEQVMFQSLEEYVETITDDAVASFSAGPYSETRRDHTGERGKLQINSWPALNELLWLMLGQVPGEDNQGVRDLLAAWLALLSGVNAPAWGVKEVDWYAQRALYGPSALTQSLGPVNPGLDFYPYD